MCSGGFSLQSQLDFHVFSKSQNGSKMDPKMDPSELQNLHLAPLEGSWERFGLSFLGFRIEAEKWVEKKSNRSTFWGGVGGMGRPVGGLEGLEFGFKV